MKHVVTAGHQGRDEQSPNADLFNANPSMKLTIVVLPFCLFCSEGSIFAVEADPGMGLESAVTANRSRPFIPHTLEVPDFIPPAPPVEKKVPVMRVDSSVIIPTTSSRTLTVIRGEASTLPDLPLPVDSKPHKARELTPEQIEQAKIWRRHQLNLGATIYDHQFSQVRWQHPDTGESYEVFCGFDVGLLAGTGGFIHKGESYSLMLMHSDLDTTQIRPVSRKWLPDFSGVPADSIVVIKGNPDDPVGMAPILAVRDIITSEKSRLIPYQAARRKHQQASAEWHKAHPAVPRDETFWLKPHRGSRYLANPKPEAATR